MGGIPIRNFYFDGTQSDLDRDLGVYMELARSYQKRKKYPRHFPKAGERRRGVKPYTVGCLPV